jgi:hypothetical protein
VVGDGVVEATDEIVLVRGVSLVRSTRPIPWAACPASAASAADTAQHRCDRGWTPTFTPLMIPIRALASVR